MPIFHDQLNRAVKLDATPRRIISLVPSQTELLYYLGLDSEIIGITKFCIHPKEKVVSAVKIGGTKQLNMQLIDELQPDLIIANKEENDPQQVEQLMAKYPVWISDINNLPSATAMIAAIGELVGRQDQAGQLIKDVEIRFNNLSTASSRLRVAYFIWRRPYMAAGTDTFINAMLEHCGLDNVFQNSRYPETSLSELVKLEPEVVLLSSEPYPFAQKHIEEFGNILPNAKITLVDGEMFSWYGSRLLHAPAYFENLLERLMKK